MFWDLFPVLFCIWHSDCGDKLLEMFLFTKLNYSNTNNVLNFKTPILLYPCICSFMTDYTTYHKKKLCVHPEIWTCSSHRSHHLGGNYRCANC